MQIIKKKKKLNNFIFQHKANHQLIFSSNETYSCMRLRTARFEKLNLREQMHAAIMAVVFRARI